MSKIRQVTDWGHIDWLEEDSLKGSRPVYIGFRNIMAGCSEPEHILYAEMQFVYVVSGTATHIVNNCQRICRTGDYLLLPVGSVEKIINIGMGDLQELIVTIPIQLAASNTADENMRDERIPVDTRFLRKVFADGVDRLAAETLNHLRMTVIITDPVHHHVYRKALPRECRDCRDKNCPLWNGTASKQKESVGNCFTALCSGGLTILVQPVMFDGHIAGYIKGGLFNEQPNIFEGNGSLLEVTGTTFHSTRLFLENMAGYLRNYYHDCRMERELVLRREKEEEDEQTTKAITDAYRQTRDTALNLQIRNHFLFNTLNSIAALAVQDGSMDTYKAILNLSDLLRGLLRKEGARVPLKEELEFLNKYLSLQQLRHEGTLRVVWNLDPRVENVIVPHNFLQPVVENAFVHAFDQQKKTKKITVTTELHGNRAVITIADNGRGMTNEELERLRMSIKENTGHGLPLVQRKLSGVFGTDFDFLVDSVPRKGTRHRIILPM